MKKKIIEKVSILTMVITFIILAIQIFILGQMVGVVGWTIAITVVVASISAYSYASMYMGE